MYPSTKPILGIYIHWPYCLSKCPYCDFASSICTQIDEKELLSGYKRDIKILYEKVTEKTTVSSVFFGGGTPSLMSSEFTETLLNELNKYFSFEKNPEISLEANPDAITIHKMKAFQQAGINRLSIGVQALNNKDLHFLGRRHTVETALKRLDEANHIFEVVNMDLIYARPGQTLKSWENELKKALALNLKHYSLYQLSIEEETPFFEKKISTVSEQHSRRLYCLTEEIMQEGGLLPYEISNYAKKGSECQHNLIYWRGQDYLGIGPAAHGRIGQIATTNNKSVINWLQNNPQTTLLTPKEKRMEKILMGLRLIQEGFPIQNLNPIGIQKAFKKKWITQKDNLIFTTQKGRLMLNQLILYVS